MLSKLFLGLRGTGVVVSLARFYWFFISTLCCELSKEGCKHFRWSTYRATILLVTFWFVPLLMVWNHIGFILDDFLFPAWAFEMVEKPLFIVGNARSGTTWFHRLLVEADNSRIFTSMRTWEIVFAQSTTWKVLFLTLFELDNKFCGGLYRILEAVDNLAFSHIKVHPLGLQEYEEDEWLMVSIGLSQLIMFLFPLGGHLLDPLVMFDKDDAVPAALREDIFSFYKDCVKKHLYAYRLLSTEEGHGNVKIFVSKNPPFTMRLETIMKFFPDARVACLLRDPIQSVPSMVSYIGKAWNTFASPIAKYPKAEGLVGFCTAAYQYPKSKFGSTVPASQCAYIKYEQLKVKPSTEMMRGLKALYCSDPRGDSPSSSMSPQSSPSRRTSQVTPDSVNLEHLRPRLKEEDEKAAKGAYKSSHTYKLEEVTGISEKGMRKLLEGIYIENSDIFSSAASKPPPPSPLPLPEIETQETQ